MSKLILKLFCLFAIGVFFVSCTHKSSQETSATSKEEGPNWTRDMREMEKELTELLPLALDAKKFNEDSSNDRIKKSLKRLKDKAQKVNHNPMTEIQDPSLRFISYDFKEQVDLIEASFLEGKKDFARYNLIHISSYCIECHTRNSMGPSFGSDKINAQLKDKSLFDQAEYLSAVRQFDQAIEKYKQFLTQEKTSSIDFSRLEQSLQSILSITVKYKKSPTEALKVLSLIRNESSLPYYLKKAIVFWVKDLEVWSHEKVREPSLSSVKSRLAQYQKRKFEQSAISGEVLILRTLGDLHGLIIKDQKPDLKAELLYMLGLSYSENSNRLYLSLDEKYFETCIRQFPKTSWALKCYQKLEEITYSSYSGSGGVFIPLEIKKRLDELKGQAGSK
jgi:hypothetical protein